MGAEPLKTMRQALASAALLGLWMSMSGCTNPPDFRRTGGTILIYQLATPADAAEFAAAPDEMIRVIQRRIDPNGHRGIQVQAYEADKIEISIPLADANTLDQIKKLLANRGRLELLILADGEKDKRLVDLAREQRGDTVLQDGKTVGKWVTVSRLSADNTIVKSKYRVPPSEHIARHPETKELLENAEAADELDAYEALVVVNPDPAGNLTDEHIAHASAQPDPQSGGWLVTFGMTGPGSQLLQEVTSRNQRDEATGQPRYFGIILDDELLSAPALQAIISSSGQITGDFTKAETEWLATLLNVGSLPFALDPVPVSESTVSAATSQSY